MTITREKFYGKAKKISPITSGSTLSYAISRVKELTASASGHFLKLPPANQMPLTPGGPVFFLINIGATNSIEVRDNGGATVVGTILPGYACEVLLREANDAAGKWWMRCRPYNTGDPFTTTTTTGGGTSGTPFPGTTCTWQGTTNPYTFNPCTILTTAVSAPRTLTGSGVSTYGTTAIYGRQDIRYYTRELAAAFGGPLTAKRRRTVSLVMAELNEGPDLECTIGSALTADRRPDEIIVVNDCSLRSPANRLRRIHSGRTKIILLENERYLGCGGSRHIGCSAADGDVIVVCDPHMLFPHDWLNKMLGYLELYPNAVLCSASTTFTPEDKFYGTGARLVRQANGFRTEWFPVRSDDPCPVVPAPLGACYMVRRDVLVHLGGWAPGLCGWGMDEEYLALRAWALGHEVRVCLDVPVKHHYGVMPDRSTKDGARSETRGWEVLYNQIVVARVMFEDGGESVESVLWDGYEQHRPVVEKKLRENQRNIRTVKNRIRARRLLNDNDLLMKLLEVDHGVAADC